MIFITSDTHFGHSNICVGTSAWSDKSGCRPFNTVEEHDKVILDNINSAVKEDDILYLLGDFTVGTKSGSLKLDKADAYVYYRNQIRCKNIIYIRGNHSLSRDKLQIINVFSYVNDYYELKYKGRLIVMFHYPIHSWNSMSNGSYHLFGHEHSGRIRGRSRDIGVDGNNYQPYNLDDVVNLLSPQRLLREGHHN